MRPETNVDFAAFIALHEPALAANEARHNLILTLMGRAAVEDPPGQTRNWSFEEPGACAVQTAARGVVMGELRREHAEALADEVAGTRFNSILGPDRSAHWFIERAIARGERFGEPWSQRIMAVEDAPVHPGVAGVARPVGAADADIFARWALGFHAEAIPGDPQPVRAHLDRQAASGTYLFWTVDGEPVSMAGLHRRTRNSASIGGVFTPPEHRGRGYAGAITAVTVERIYAEGRKTACLYADMANPWSNRCYEKIGFKPICESWFFPQAE